MAYADRNDGGNKVVAIVIVAIIHVALGYAFVTGLAYQYVKKVSEKLNTFDVAPPPPPPPDEPPPPPPPDQPLQPPPVVTPPAIVHVQTPSPAIVTVPNPPPAYTPAPPAPPAPAAPPAPRLASGAQPRGNYADWFPNDYYPPAAKRAGIEGRVGVVLTVGADGRVSDCTVTSSSGNADLDDTTCRLAKRSGRFKPALDDTGKPIESKFRIPGVRWRLVDE